MGLTNARYRSEIDGLRAFAVLSVVLFHAFPYRLTGGFIGVDIFFVISGFLITSHIFQKLEKGAFSFSQFLGRRIRRIFPALILVMSCALAFGSIVLLADEFSQLGQYVASGAVFVTNFVLVDGRGYFDNSSETKPMVHLWSLAVEEQFYIVWPLILWLAWRWKLNLLALTVVVAAISFGLNLKFVDSHPIATFFLPMGRFWEILSGSILAWLILYKGTLFADMRRSIDERVIQMMPWAHFKGDGSATLNVAALFGMLLLGWGVWGIDRQVPYPSGWALVPVLGALLIIASGSQAWLNRILLMNPIAVWFGLISYPLYLWHWPILSFLQIIETETPAKSYRLAAVAVSVLLGWATYKFVEGPIRFGSIKQKAHPLVMMLVLFGVGGLGYYISKTDWSNTNSVESVMPKRRNFEHALGSSLNWYQGKDNWLFLGNDFNQTVAKRRLAITPAEEDIAKEVATFEALAKKGAASDVDVVLLIGPDKSSVYAEYLPDEIQPSVRRYSEFFTERFGDIKNLKVFDPTDLLVEKKSNEGLLYWRTDTHWNQKGAYLALESMLIELGLEVPEFLFKLSGQSQSGDLLEKGMLKDFPLGKDDDWNYEFANQLQSIREQSKDPTEKAFGWLGRVFTTGATNDLSVWVVGDSFTTGLRPYIEAAFTDVQYVGYWPFTLNSLPAHLENAPEKPDLVLVVRVERSF